MDIVIATGNQGKVDEFTELFADWAVTVRCNADYPNMPEAVEDGGTFHENALIKARTACGHTGLTALADDSGLEVDALDGAPGVHSARFAPTAEARNTKLLSMLADIPDQFRTARFVCCLALVRPDGFEWTVEGTVEGEITHEPAGEGGFGYDPIFYYPLLGMTFAQIPRAEKNKISHRGQAMALFKRTVLDDNILGLE